MDLSQAIRESPPAPVVTGLAAPDPEQLEHQGKPRPPSALKQASKSALRDPDAAAAEAAGDAAAEGGETGPSAAVKQQRFSTPLPAVARAGDQADAPGRPSGGLAGLRRQSSAASCPALSAVESESRMEEQSMLAGVSILRSGSSTALPPASRSRPTTAGATGRPEQRVLFQTESEPTLMVDQVKTGPPTQAAANKKAGSTQRSNRAPVTVRIEPMIPTRPATAPDKLALALDCAARGGAEEGTVVPLRKRFNMEDWEVPGVRLRAGSPAKAEEAQVNPLKLADDWLQEPLRSQGIERIGSKSPRPQSKSPPASPRKASKEKAEQKAAAQEAAAKHIDKKALAQMASALQHRQKLVKPITKSIPAKQKGADAKERITVQREYVPVASPVKLQHRKAEAVS